MNRRLQQFLDLEQLTPARLAATLGIQPSGISHILSGRNKPSFEFINNFLQKFPNINAEWLITGKGKPYKNQENSPFLPDSSETIDFHNTEFLNQTPEPETDTGDLSLKIPSENAKITIKRITLFFSDGSFQEFYPPK